MFSSCCWTLPRLLQGICYTKNTHMRGVCVCVCTKAKKQSDLFILVIFYISAMACTGRPRPRRRWREGAAVPAVLNGLVTCTNNTQRQTHLDRRPKRPSERLCRRPCPCLSRDLVQPSTATLLASPPFCTCG
jgi:hypothetical protein